MIRFLRKTNKAYSFHLLLWGLLMIITYIIGVQVKSGPGLLTFTFKFMGYYALFIGTFYGYYAFLVPKVLRSRWWVFLLMVGLLFIVFYSFRHYIDYVLFEFNPSNKIYSLLWEGDPKKLEGRLMGGLVLYVFWSGVAVFFRLLIDWFRDEKLKVELKNQQLDSELAYLRSQVNPHFLFNTLNNIYALAYKRSEHTPEAIMKLSSMMRYMLYETNSPKVSLEKEIENLYNYIELQKLRRKEQDWIDFQVEGEVANKRVAPLLLVPLLENAFKHGSPKSKVIMNLAVNKEKLEFFIANQYSEHEPKDAVGGVGLQNIKRRLELIYPEAYMMKTSQVDGRFEVNLEINFKETYYEKAELHHRG